MSEFIHNPLAQSLLLGPLIGVIFGAAFSGLTQSPVQRVPQTVFQTQKIYATSIIERRNSTNSSDDGIGFFIAIGIAILLILWNYAKYFDTIQYYLANSILLALSFSITTIILSLLKGHYTSRDWWFYTTWPLVSLVVCIYLLYLAKTNFDPSIQQLALSYSAWDFYTEQLTDYNRNFIFTHVLGVVILTSIVCITALALIHYLSLMNQRSIGFMQNVWFFLTKHTSFFSEKSWPIFMIILLIIAYIFINPEYATSWLMKY